MNHASIQVRSPLLALFATRVVELRYVAASVVALAVDMGIFFALLVLLVPAASASAVGYSAGVLTHWLLSSRIVFVGNVARRGPQRTKQKAMFVVSAVVGLAVTIAIVTIASFAALDPWVAKLVAVVVAFAITWLMRNKIVFGPARASE